MNVLTNLHDPLKDIDIDHVTAVNVYIRFSAATWLIHLIYVISHISREIMSYNPILL